MRFKSKSALLALVAVFAVSAVAVASASATTPEFKPVPTKKKFTTSGEAVTMVGEGYEIACASSSSAAEITGARTIGDLVVRFTGCKLIADGSECAIQSLSGKAEEIVTKALKGELGTVKTTEATSGVGLLLKPESGKVWTETASSTCRGESKWTGSLAAEVATIGKKQATNKLVFGVTANQQTITKITLDSGELAKPEFIAWSEPLAVGASDEAKFEEALEVVIAAR